MSKEQEQLLQWIDESDNIVFFGGAGVSTESKIPDFRSVDGLYKQNYDYPPETILSHSFYIRNPEEFYRFYRDKLIVKGAKPNAAHLRLAKLEREGRRLEQLRLLRMHRTVLLDRLHASQRQIDCLDYLIYQMDRG